MAQSVQELLVKLEADISSYRSGLNQAGAKTKSFASKAKANFSRVRGSINRMGGALTNIKGLLAGLGVGLVAVKFVKAFQVQEQAVASLDASIVSMGRTTAGLSGELQSLASQIQREGILGDEAIIQGQSFLSTYGDITDELLPRTSRVMADLAAKTGSVTGAANILGKASMGLTGALSIAGISLSDAAKESKDFEIILGEIEQQVGGLNAALGATATGAMQQLGNAFGDLQEEGGKFLSLALERPFRALTEVLLNDLDSSLKTNQDSARSFGKTIIDSLESGATVVGVFADGIHGIGIIIDLLKAGFQGFTLLVSEIFVGLTIIVEEFINSTIRGFNSIGDLAPDLMEALGISRLQEVDLASGLVEDVETTRAALGETMAGIHETLMEELPSTGIENKMKEIRAEFDKLEQKAKESSAEVNESLGAGGATTGGGDAGGQASQKFLDGLETRLEALRESSLTELEVIQERFNAERLLVESALENKLIDEEDFMDLREEMQQRHQSTLLDIEMDRLKKSAAQERAMNQARLQVATGMLDNLTTLMDSGSKKQFRIGKLAAKATVVIKGIEAVQSAYAAGNTVGGPIVGAAFAATAAIASAQQLSKINSTQFGGGGSISAPGGTNPATGGPGTVPPPIPSQQAGTDAGQVTQEPRVIINIQGSVFNSDETVDLLAEQISEAVEGRGVRLIAAETI